MVYILNHNSVEERGEKEGEERGEKEGEERGERERKKGVVALWKIVVILSCQMILPCVQNFTFVYS